MRIDKHIFRTLFGVTDSFQSIRFWIVDSVVDIELRVLRYDLAFASGNVNLEQASRVHVETGRNPERLVVRRKPVNPSEGLIRAPVDQFAPGCLTVIAQTD